MSTRILRFVLMMFLAVSLVQGAPAKTKKKRPSAPPVVLGPATLMELGKGVARLGLLLDPATGELTARFLEADSDEHVRVSQEKIRITGTVEGKAFVVLLDAISDPTTDEKKWDTSLFRGRSEDLVGAQAFSGTLFFVRLKERNFSKVRFQYRTDEGEARSEVPTATPR